MLTNPLFAGYRYTPGSAIVLLKPRPLAYNLSPTEWPHDGQHRMMIICNSMVVRGAAEC
jgi:hypothetical protein